MGNRSVSAWSMLSILGGLIAMVSLFMTYVSIDFVVNSIGTVITTNSGFTGLEVVQREVSINSLTLQEDNFSIMCYLPAVTAACGALCAVMGLITLSFGCKRCNFVTLLFAIFGLLAAGGFLLLAMGEGMFDGTVKDLVSGMIEAGKIGFNVEAGQYLAIAGSGIAFIGSLISTHKVLN